MDVTVGRVLFSEEEIRKRAKEVAEQINEDYKGEPVYLVVTLSVKMTIYLVFPIYKAPIRPFEVSHYAFLLR